MIMAVRPCSRVSRAWWTAASLSRSSEEVASSRMRIRGSRNSARAIDYRKNSIVVEPDVVVPTTGDAIRWYHRNEKSRLPQVGRMLLVPEHALPLLGDAGGGRLRPHGATVEDVQRHDAAAQGTHPVRLQARRHLVSVQPLCGG